MPSHSPVLPGLRSNARRMRGSMTEAELKLWNELRAHRLMGLSFRRQYPVADFILDFACPSLRLAIEVDGSQHGEDAQHERDRQRTQRLQHDGWTVLRFWNDDVLRDIEGVCNTIVATAFPGRLR